MSTHPPEPTDEIEIEAAPGVRLGVSRWLRDRPTAVVVAPGFFRSRHSPMLVATAARIAAAHDVYLFDFRGHGTSTGRYTFGRRETDDLAAVLAHVRGRGHVRIAVVGFSMGGTVAVRTLGAERRAGRDPQIAALVTVSSPSEVSRLRPRLPPRGLLGQSFAAERHRLPRLDLATLVRHRLDTVALAAWISPTPWLVLHNLGDWLVPHAMAEALHRGARPPCTLHLFRNRARLHADALVRTIPDEFFGVLEPFLQARLCP
ncbi:MAG: alpha/beta fold hydrolase [bacterium]